MLFQNCNNCTKEIDENASFCKHCGVSLLEQFIVCANCKCQNAKGASFCGQCGSKLNTNDALGKEYLGLWMNSLRQRILDVHRTDNLEVFLEAFYSSGFHKTFLGAANQLGDEVEEILQSKVHQANKKATTLVENRIEDLVDFFVIHHCKAFNPVSFSEKILKYQKIDTNSFSLLELILVYLDLESEKFPYHIDFLKMPVAQLKNASNSFLFPSKGEKIWLIADLSLLDNAKEGFALTDAALYWKAPFEPANSIYYTQLESIQMDKEWLLINGNFFNANASLNLKMLYLLRKLKRVFA